MANRLSAIWIILIVTVLRTCRGASTEQQIELAANYLKVVVVVTTNHEIGGKYTMTIRLSNPPTNQNTLLPEQDWQILFHHENRIKPTVSKDGELILYAAESCLYILAPKSGSKYNGISRSETKVIELEVTGLSIFKSIVFPNFAIYTPTVSPRNILSTSDDKLSFVFLDDKNKTTDDLSMMQGSRRLAITPDVVDRRRVPLSSFIIPAPQRVEVQLGRIFDLPASQKLNYVFDPEVTAEFQERFLGDLAKVPGIGQAKLNKLNNESSYVANEDMIMVRLVASNSTQAQSISRDAYNFTVTPKDPIHFDLELIAKDMKGLYNAKSTMFGIMGIFNAIPQIVFNDDTSFDMRSVEIDLTSNFFGFPTLKTLIDIMAMYKLNQLVVNLADNKGWRLEVANYGFDELHTFGSRRCVDLNQCLPSWFGAGNTATPNSERYFSKFWFKELVKYGAHNGVDVIPKFNFGGGMLAAKLASVRRYNNLKATNIDSAKQFLLFSDNKPDGEKAPADEYCLRDAALNPCIPQTEDFIRLIVKYVYELYVEANVTLKAIHAGGDDWVNSYEHYPECKQQQLDKPALLRKMVAMIQRASPVDVIVNEQLVVDTNTMECIPAQVSSGPSGAGPLEISRDTPSENIDQSRLMVQFSKHILVDTNKLGLNQQELDFLFAEIEPPPPPGNQSAADAYIPDFRKRYAGVRRGIKAPWAKAYRCGNAGFQFVLSPEGYTNLDAGRELSWDEIGHHRSDSYSTIDRHRMMLLEPYNIHINIDQAADMTPILSYRICQIVDCTELTTEGARKLRGLGATIGTQVIRKNDTLFEHTLPLLATVGEKAWRRPLYENTLKPTDLSTYENGTLAALRSQYLMFEMMQHLNTWGYKQRGIHDALDHPYRVGRVSAAIANGLLSFPPTPPPWPIIVKTDEVGSPVQFRDSINSTWRNLYKIDPVTGAILGGYTMAFPMQLNQRLELRLTSANGVRSSKPTVIYADPRNLVPAGVPFNLREDTCLDVKKPDIDIAKISPNQWAKIINNIAAQNAEENQFGQQRMQQLNGLFMRYQRFDREAAQLTLTDVMDGIEQLVSLQRPLHGVYKYIFDQDKLIIEGRERALKAKMDRWQQKYLNDPTCPKPKTNNSKKSKLI